MDRALPRQEQQEQFMEYFPFPREMPEHFTLTLKETKSGTSTVHFSGLYWAGENKDEYYPISLTHPFVVEEPSKNSENSSRV